MKRPLAATVFLILGTLSFSAEKPRIFVHSGHPDGILCLAKDPVRGLLFTGGRDGAVRVWREEGFEPVARIQASPFAVRKMAAHPRSSEIAVVESDGSSFTMSVWDWERNVKKFSVFLPELPSIFQYSPQGNFIIASRTDWKSLLFFDASNGRPLPYFSSGFGIVSFIFLSSSENTMVSYTPSTGTFIYWNLRQGTRKQTVMSMPELRNLSLYNERYAAASAGTDLVIIDLVTGAVAASSYCEAVKKIITDDKSGTIVTISGEGSSTELQTWRFRFSSSSSGPEPLHPGIGVKIPEDTQDTVFGKNRVYLAGNGLSSFDPGSWETRVLSEPSIERASDAFPVGDSLHIVTADRVYRFSSDFFSAPAGNKLPKAKFLDVDKIENPFKEPAFLSSPSTDQAFLWKRGEDRGEILKMDPRTGAVLARLSVFGTPLLHVQSSAEYLLCLEKSGSIKKISTLDFRPSFEFTSTGFQSVVSLGQYGILAGQNSTGNSKLPLVSINPDTGETVSLRHPSVFFFFNMEYDSRREKIYLLGLRKNEAGRTETVLQSASASQLETFSVLTSVDSIDLEADVHVDGNSTAYTNIGGGPILAWNGTSWTRFEPNGNRPLRLSSSGDKLYAVNRDGTVTIWDKATGRVVFDLCVFKDGNWIAYTPAGNFLSSADEINLPRYLALSFGGKILPAQKTETYRLYVPGSDEPGR